jgi:hypothetical protein
MWDSVASQHHEGTYVHALVTYGDDTDIVFYSALLNTVVECGMPSGSSPGRHMSEDMALVFQNGLADYLFDARTGIVHSRGCDYGTASLGTDAVVGYDPDAGALHAYSQLSGAWTTHDVDGTTYVYVGGKTALGIRYDFRRYYGFAGAEDAWAELETVGTALNNQIGDRTAIVMDSDRLYALWQDQATPVPGDEAPSLGEAVAQMRCHPNPFNGRMNVVFELPQPAEVRIEVFDVRGHKVATLLNELRDAGPVTAVWNTGRAASGVYLVRLAAEERTAVRKVTLVE